MARQARQIEGFVHEWLEKLSERDNSQNEDQCWIFWALLVLFRLGIVHQEGFVARARFTLLGFLGLSLLVHLSKMKTEVRI